jgi:hypothetical protein
LVAGSENAISFVLLPHRYEESCGYGGLYRSVAGLALDGLGALGSNHIASVLQTASSRPEASFFRAGMDVCARGHECTITVIGIYVLPSPITAIAAGRRPPEESSLRAVVPPEARRPPPRVDEWARVRVARVPTVDRRAVLRNGRAGAQDRGDRIHVFCFFVGLSSIISNTSSGANPSSGGFSHMSSAFIIICFKCSGKFPEALIDLNPRRAAMQNSRSEA